MNTDGMGSGDMKTNQYDEFMGVMARIWMVVFLMAGLTNPSSFAANVKLWDTGKKLAEAGDLADQAAWKVIPTDLFQLEANPAKSASDPGYYGREVRFAGDVVVENPHLNVVFWSAKGRVAVHARGAGLGNPLGKLMAEFTPTQDPTKAVTISRCELIRNGGDEVVVKAVFATKGGPETFATVSVGRSEVVEIKPSPKLKATSLLAPLEHGIAPSFIGDDLMFSPGDYPDAKGVNVLAENFFVGLPPGRDTLLVLTWPKGAQQLRLKPGAGQFQAVEFDTDGQSLYLGVLSAPHIWHRETLTSAYLEKEVTSKWSRPYAAKWKTQLSEAGIKTSYAFREAKNTIWRGVPGSYNYPVWFTGNNATFFLGKKIPPKGDAVIYFLEGSDTPLSVTTPVDVLRMTLGRATADNLLDPEGRKLRTHHRRDGDGGRRACTCGCTDAIQAIFEAGKEVDQKPVICEAIDDMIFFVEAHVSRIDEYRKFADETAKFLRAKQKSNPALKAYLESMEEIVQRIPQEYEVQKENMKTLAYAKELNAKTVALAAKKDAQNLPQYMELLKAWRAMGGAQDYVVAQCHTVTRRLFQDAAYACVEQPAALETAREIQSRCRQILRNPDGYEIWPEY
jgi:hypothetical protein